MDGANANERTGSVQITSGWLIFEYVRLSSLYSKIVNLSLSVPDSSEPSASSMGMVKHVDHEHELHEFMFVFRSG
jgi:hypothetical protein